MITSKETPHHLHCQTKKHLPQTAILCYLVRCVHRYWLSSSLYIISILSAVSRDSENQFQKTKFIKETTVPYGIESPVPGMVQEGKNLHASRIEPPSHITVPAAAVLSLPRSTATPRMRTDKESLCEITRPTSPRTLSDLPREILFQV